MSGGFFDTHQKLTTAKAASAPSRQMPAVGEPMSPSQLNRLVESALKSQLPSTLLVRGEVSNFKCNSTSGHCYFTLKDSTGCIDAVMWASSAKRLRFEPRDGMELLATGSIGVYVPRGRYQLVATSLDPVGEGALEVAKRQLEEKLRGLGLFDVERKRDLPRYPRTIAFVTSRQAAGFADMLKILSRTPWLRVMVYHVPVQGAAAAPAIAAALKHLSDCSAELCVDVIVLGRGGGSLEDLWAFNEEVIAHAMAASVVPIVTGIGHEVDVSIADLVADYHAHTPTEAAAQVIRQWTQVDDAIDVLQARLRREVRARVQAGRQQVNSIERHELFRRPGTMLDSQRQALDEREAALVRALKGCVGRHRSRVDRAAAMLAQHPPSRPIRAANGRLRRLDDALQRASNAALTAAGRRVDSLDARLRALSPLNVLKRGYSITTRKRDGAIVRGVTDVRAGEKLITRLSDGTIESIANDPKQPELF
jgi:exodeoxyribonuclease VII large subunit